MMKRSNRVFIATSLDGYIADKNGGIDWLHSVPNPNGDDMGFVDFMHETDALVMGRTTFETVCSFDVPWPYNKPVFVLSTTMNEIPESHQGKAFLVKGELSQVLEEIHQKGYNSLYIDGGTTIQSFLKADLIDELCISTIPILLGGGSPLFSDLPTPINFDLVETKTYLNQITQNYYKRKN